MNTPETPAFGILGLGVELPDEVRTNAWWPPATVARWQDKAQRQLTKGSIDPDDLPSDGARRTVAALAALADDPFQGARERRVFPAGTLATDVGAAAARKALEAAGVDPSQVAVLLCHSTAPDYQNTPDAALIHRHLGAPEDCFTTDVHAACNAFAMQATLAERLLRAGPGRYAVLVQVSLMSPLLPYEDAWSAWIGDGATAVVLGPVSQGRGLLGHAHRTDGVGHRTMVMTVPGKRWYDDGRVYSFPDDKAAARQMLLRVADRGRQIVHEALGRAGYGPEDVDFFACHQATKWIRPVAQAHAGLEHARAVDTFPWAGSLVSANLPLVLATAQREGLLRDGDLVATFSGGTGETWSSLVMRWGR